MARSTMSRIKICGLSRIEDISAVNLSWPDYIGFVFAPSRRQVDEKTATILKENLDRRIQAVGVFVNQEIETVMGLYQSGVIDLVQLHGDEDEDYIARLKGYCGCPVIKAIGIGDTLPPLPQNVDHYLFDTLSSRRGGTGKVFDWRVLQNYSGLPYFLAGGLTIANMPDAIQLLAPFCIDVSTGAETDGKKDADKIYQIVSLVRAELLR
jgi:phosphoribosylanthranilate isomerase